MTKRRFKKSWGLLFSVIILVLMSLNFFDENITNENLVLNNNISYKIDNIPEYTGEIYVEINNNSPQFSVEDFNITEDYYSNLDNGKVRNGND